MPTPTAASQSPWCLSWTAWAAGLQHWPDSWACVTRWGVRVRCAHRRKAPTCLCRLCHLCHCYSHLCLSRPCRQQACTARPAAHRRSYRLPHPCSVSPTCGVLHALSVCPVPACPPPCHRPSITDAGSHCYTPDSRRRRVVRDAGLLLNTTTPPNKHQHTQHTPSPVTRQPPTTRKTKRDPAEDAAAG
jgi:hypothetical protein